MAQKKFAVQLDASNYNQEHYDTFQRFGSYYYQIAFTRAAQPRTVLEIGMGNGLVTNYLRKQAGCKVTTCDFDAEMKPDVLADIREKLPIKSNSHDVVIGCEILEHVPFKHVPGALAEFARIAKKRVVISIPYSSLTLEAIFAPTLTYGPGKTVRLPLRIPQFWASDVHEFNPYHYWELGRRGYSKRMFRKLLRKHFRSIVKEFHPHLNPYHTFFVLEV